MLELAYLCKEALQREYARAIIKPENKFFNGGNYYEYELNIKKESFDDLQLVSVSKKEEGAYCVNGYFCANLDRTTNSVIAIQTIRFNNSIAFSLDLAEFLKSLFEKYNFRKIGWFVTIGNPAEKMYDRITAKWGGSIIGTFKDHVMLPDGKLYDQKYYEIFKSTYDVMNNK
jgi:hypothetical protein